MTSPPTLADIRAAADRIAGKVHRTPLWRSTRIDDMIGAKLHLKCESFQKTGSFKARGALNKILTLSDEERAAGLITVSAGNHAGAVAWAAHLGGFGVGGGVALLVRWRLLGDGSGGREPERS